MSPEVPRDPAVPPTGWIFFDAECRFCLAARRRWGRIFERRGFVWLPIQTPGTAERLGVTAEQLSAEMWVLPAGADPRHGVDAWIHLMGHVGWLRPLGRVLGLPGVKRLAATAYRWMARHRHCLGGRCRGSPGPPRPGRRHVSFLELP